MSRDLSPELIEAAAAAVDRRLREKEAERSLSLAYRNARRVISVEQAEIVFATVERRLVRLRAYHPRLPEQRLLDRHLSSLEFAELFRSALEEADRAEPEQE